MQSKRSTNPNPDQRHAYSSTRTHTDADDTAINEARGNVHTMKKLATLITAALVLSLAVPAFAAVDVGGKVGTKFTLEKNDSDEWELKGDAAVELETKISTGGGNPVKAVVQLTPWELNSGEFDDDDNPVGDLGDAHKPKEPVAIGIDKAWIETEGAFWHGGPSVRTRLGDVNIEWDQFVGHLGDKRGVTVEGIEVGPVTADAFYTWHNDDRPMGLAVRGTVEGVDLQGMLVKRGSENNLMVGAGLEVMPGVDVNAKMALDAERRHLYRLEANADSLIEGIKLTVGYRGADEAFDPMYTNRWDGTDELYDLRNGFNIAAETEQSGFRIKGDYDDPTGEANVNVSRDLELAGFAVAGEYNAKIRRDEDVEHTVKASTTVDLIPQLQGLALSGQVKLQGGNIDYEAAADYAAPNGINFGAKYASDKGVSATAGVTVEF